MTLWDFIKDDPFYFGFFGLLLVLIVLYGGISLVLRTYCKVKSNKNNQYKPPNWVSFILEDKHGQSIVLFLLAIFCIVFLVVFCFFNYWEVGTLSDEIGDWGAVGDYFGGMLNPILAFASFMALLYTIRIQSEELRLTRQELTKSSDAQQKSADSQSKQLTLQKQLEEFKAINSIYVNYIGLAEDQFRTRVGPTGSLFEISIDFLSVSEIKVLTLKSIMQAFLQSRDDFKKRADLFSRSIILAKIQFRKIEKLSNNMDDGFNLLLESYASNLSYYLFWVGVLDPNLSFEPEDISDSEILRKNLADTYKNLRVAPTKSVDLDV